MRFESRMVVQRSLSGFGRVGAPHSRRHLVRYAQVLFFTGFGKEYFLAWLSSYGVKADKTEFRLKENYTDQLMSYKRYVWVLYYKSTE